MYLCLNFQAVSGIPENVLLNPISPTTLMATWDVPKILNGILEGYLLDLTNLQSAALSRVENVSAQVNQYTWTELHPYYFYEVSIATLTSAGRSPHILQIVQMLEAGIYIYMCVCMYVYWHNLGPFPLYTLCGG